MDASNGIFPEKTELRRTGTSSQIFILPKNDSLSLS
jgi:hypothetical protein